MVLCSVGVIEGSDKDLNISEQRQVSGLTFNLGKSVNQEINCAWQRKVFEIQDGCSLILTGGLHKLAPAGFSLLHKYLGSGGVQQVRLANDFNACY